MLRLILGEVHQLDSAIQLLNNPSGSVVKAHDSGAAGRGFNSRQWQLRLDCHYSTSRMQLSKEL